MRKNSWLSKLSLRLASPKNRKFARPIRHRGDTTAAAIEWLECRQLLSGNTLVVNTLADTAQAGLTTLRQAINQATRDAPGDVISFSSDLSGIITLSGGFIKMNHSMSLTGPGASQLTISGGNLGFDLFFIQAPQVTISGLTLASNTGTGAVRSSNNGDQLTVNNDVFFENFSSSPGGAILSDGTLISSDNTYSNNRTTGNDGGAIASEGPSMTSVQDVFFANEAVNRGGALFNECL